MIIVNTISFRSVGHFVSVVIACSFDSFNEFNYFYVPYIQSTNGPAEESNDTVLSPIKCSSLLPLLPIRPCWYKSRSGYQFFSHFSEINSLIMIFNDWTLLLGQIISHLTLNLSFRFEPMEDYFWGNQVLETSQNT